MTDAIKTVRIPLADAMHLIRQAIPIEHVIRRHVQLQLAGGGSLKGLCPFHDEMIPSFNVTPKRGLWYCFGCAEGGDVIKFVSKIEKVGVKKAVARLASMGDERLDL